MAISMDRSVRHMAWANQRVYAAFSALPDVALDAYIVNPEWTARRILQHIVASADWYVYCLGIAPWHGFDEPKTISELAGLAKTLEMCDAQIATALELDDEVLTYQEGEFTGQVLRSTLISEAVLHATEHRAQLMDAIESRGSSAISLDSIDLWAFESFERESSK
jgi:uncharacterized damage-inducible protein DinB